MYCIFLVLYLIIIVFKFSTKHINIYKYLHCIFHNKLITEYNRDWIIMIIIIIYLKSKNKIYS